VVASGLAVVQQRTCQKQLGQALSRLRAVSVACGAPARFSQGVGVHTFEARRDSGTEGWAASTPFSSDFFALADTRFMGSADAVAALEQKAHTLLKQANAHRALSSALAHDA